MSSVSYVNGSYVDHSEARVSIEDRAISSPMVFMKYLQ